MGQTNSDTNHEKIRSLGITPVLKADADEKKFDYVVFSAPPQGGPGSPGYINAEGYVADVLPIPSMSGSFSSSILSNATLASFPHHWLIPIMHPIIDR